MSYIDTPRHQRQDLLKGKYSFVCKCEACVKNYPMTNDLPIISTMPPGTSKLTNKLLHIEDSGENMDMKMIQRGIKAFSKFMSESEQHYPDLNTVMARLMLHKCMTLFHTAAEKPLSHVLVPKKIG